MSDAKHDAQGGGSSRGAVAVSEAIRGAMRRPVSRSGVDITCSIHDAASELGRHITTLTEQMAAAFYLETGHLPEVHTHDYHDGRPTIILCERYMGPSTVEIPPGLAEPLAAKWALETSLPASRAQIVWWLDGAGVAIAIQQRADVASEPRHSDARKPFGDTESR